MGKVTTREMYKERLEKGEVSEEDLKFIENYKYKGKTQDQWLDLVERCQGTHKNGNPKWYRFMDNAIYADVIANLFLIKNQIIYDEIKENRMA